MKLLFTLLLLTSRAGYAQINEKELFKQSCEQEISGVKNLENLSVVIAVPCSWKMRDKSTYSFKSDIISLSLGNTVKVFKFDANFVISDRAGQIVKLLNDSNDEFIINSSKKIRIKGNDCIVYETKKSLLYGQVRVFMRNFYYFIKSSDRLILLDYMYSSIDERYLTKNYLFYKNLYYNLSQKIKIKGQ
ncbi:hypothetical protein [Flavobacterium sp.]|uniref:hypothetical protein n=1 Tax=Flavobacterium sp. TaxID=239 RepID=UPI00374D1C4B